jgi:hypothetical protein
MNDDLVPLYGFVAGDSLGLLVLVRASDSIEKLSATLAQAAAVRVAPATRTALFAGERRLDPALSVAEEKLAPLERIDLVEELA